MTVKRGVGISSSFSDKFIDSKKGQVTIFIIVGILLLFVFAGILFLTKTTVEEKVDTSGEPIILEAPQAFQPIQTYTENCLAQIGKRGLLILGEQGGYIYPELVGDYSFSEPSDADGLNLQPLKVPYWHYNSEANTANKVVIASLQPKLYDDGENSEMSIEAQLGRYVKEKLESCLDAYEPFAAQGYTIISSGERNVDVIVTDNSVNFHLLMKVNVKKGDAEVSMEQFYVKIPLQLKHYYDIANLIADSQRNYSFLEKQGMELISVYSRKDMEHFPPISDVGYELFSALSWSEFELKEKFKGLLASYVPVLRFLGSENFYYSVFPDGNFLAQKVVDNMVLPLTGAEDLKVNFDYFGWEPYFSMNSEEGIVRPDHTFINYGVLSFGTQRYETHYDASYPVLVTIKDERGIDGAPYSFVFALESNIRNNAPAVHDEVRETYPRRISSIACNEEQRATGMLKTVVVDSFTKEPLEMVKIGFTIPEQDECEMGITNFGGELESEYPAVYGGVVNLIHYDYLTSFYPIDTYKYKGKEAMLGYPVSGVEEERVIEMDRFVTKKVKVKKKELKKCIIPLRCEETDVLVYSDISCENAARQCFFNSGGLLSGKPVFELVADGSLSRTHQYYFINGENELAPTEEVTLTLERVKGFHDEVVSGEFFTSVSVKGNEETSVDLVPGIYKVSGMVTDSREYKIPAEKRCFQYDILTRTEEECVDFDENVMASYVSGNLQWKTPETYLEITPEQLYTSDEVTFYVLTQELLSVPEKFMVAGKQVSGRVLEDLQVPGKIAELTNETSIRRALEPKWQ